jgi:hypothetical protein
MDGSPQCGLLSRNHPMALRCRRVGAVHSIKLRRTQCEHMFSASPPTPDIARCSRHFAFGPCVDGSGLARRIFTLQRWSEQPCVRPVCAVLMTAGHNALRGSGPGQQHAFEDAMAHVGCPDRRIDRHCIKCCSPSQPLRHAGLSGVISFTPRERQAPGSVRSWPS